MRSPGRPLKRPAGRRGLSVLRLPIFVRVSFSSKVDRFRQVAQSGTVCFAGLHARRIARASTPEALALFCGQGGADSPAW